MAENCMSFREVVQKKGFPIRWKEITVNTGGSGSTIQDLKVPESAGGYVYRDGNRLQSYARNRFIYWRVHKDTLELVELSLDNDLHGNAIRLHFQDSAILGDISIFESRGEVVFLVATVSSVHRLVFPHPSSLQHQMSIFTDASVVNLCEPSDCHSISPVSNVAYSLHAAGAWLTTEGEALFALATSTGSILFIKLPPKGIQGIVTQHELKHASMMQRLWTGLVPAMIRGGPSEADMAESVCLHSLGQDVFIFAICRDHKLRMWSCKNQECVLVSDMLDFIPDKLDPLKGTIGARGHVIRKSVEGNMLHLGVFLNFSDRNQFCIFQPVLADGRYQLNLITTVFAPNEDLVEFSLTNTHLWSLWTTSESETVVRYAALDNSDNFSYDPWNMVHLQQPESPEVIVPLHREPRETYMDYIFYPGRFTAQTISKALNIYRRSLDSLMGHGLHISSQVLREEVTAAVENEIQNSAGDYELSEEEYSRLQLQQWSRFYSCCLQYHEVGTKPIGLFCDGRTGISCLIRKHQVSLLRPCDILEHLYMSPLDSCVPETLLETQLIADDIQTVQDVLALCDCMKLLNGSLPEEVCLAFEHEIFYLENPETVAQQMITALLPASGNQIVAQDLGEIEMRVQNIADIARAVANLLELADLANGQPEGLMMDDIVLDATRQLVCSRLWSSNTAVGLLSTSVQQTAETRFCLARDLLLLQTLMLRAGEQAGLTLEIADQLKSDLIPRTSDMVRAYFVVKWLSTTVATQVQTNTIESNLRQLDVLDISDATGRTHLHRHSVQDQTLVELFLEGSGGSQSRVLLANNNFLDEDPCQLWTVAFQPMVTMVAQLLWPISANFLLPEFLMGQCQFSQLQEYVRLLQCWCPWNPSSRKFLLGQCYLNCNEPAKALDCFQEAVHGVGNEDFLLNKLVQADEISVRKLEIVYYLKVIKLLEQFSLPDHIISLANTAISVADEDDQNIPTLWSKVFKHHLELGHNDEAYSAMISNPDPVRKKDCLRQFIVVLCEQKQLKALVDFPYIDLHDEVVNIIESRARSVDLATHNYYDLLYAFHIFRGNFRKAASVMYEHGMRLGQELPGVKGLQKKAKCYLACIHSLGLVDPKYGWIVKPVPLSRRMDEELPGVSPKRDLEGEERERVNQKMEVIELPDIEKEYRLVHARLKLLQKGDDPALAAGPSLSASETVGLLVSAGLFDDAVNVCKLFKMSLTQVFEGLALRCINLSQHNYQKDVDFTTETWGWLAANDTGTVNSGKETSAADQAWKLLQTYLAKHEDGSSRYHRCVAIKLLGHGYNLPDWMLVSYKVVNAPELIRLYIDYDLLEEATYLAMDYIDAVMGKGKEYFGLKTSLNVTSPSVWLPYTSIDQLLHALREVHTDNTYLQLYQELSEKLDIYHHNVERISRDRIDAATRRASMRLSSLH